MSKQEREFRTRGDEPDVEGHIVRARGDSEPPPEPGVRAEGESDDEPDFEGHIIRSS